MIHVNFLFLAQVAYPTEVNVHPWDSTSVKITWRGVLTKTLESTVTGYKVKSSLPFFLSDN